MLAHVLALYITTYLNTLPVTSAFPFPPQDISPPHTPSLILSPVSSQETLHPSLPPSIHPYSHQGFRGKTKPKPWRGSLPASVSPFAFPTKGRQTADPGSDFNAEESMWVGDGGDICGGESAAAGAMSSLCHPLYHLTPAGTCGVLRMTTQANSTGTHDVQAPLGLWKRKGVN